MSRSLAKKPKLDDSKNNVFIVEKVLDKRPGKAGREEFLIQWQGFSEDDSSWEPRENLHCIELLEEFEKEYAKRDRPIRRRQKSPEQDVVAGPAEEEPSSSDKFSLNGKQLKCIVGLTRSPGELHFLCKFNDDTARLLPAKEINNRYRPFVDEYGIFLRRQMDKRQKRLEEGKKKSIDADDDDDEWPDIPPGYNFLNVEDQDRHLGKETRFSQDKDISETPTASDILRDIHIEANESMLSSFPHDSAEETLDSVETNDSLLAVFDDSSNSPPPCPIVIDTVPDDDELLFPGLP
ncbi:CRE-HPL-2 protein [Caenorhabditis remanei]|uniref:CRE-HPL-2 protein n=1 Tax=Caenorhabditis remanei TaxID=31234 RepID=E3LZH5_CAERE|nr:CRE-HPL-2 protein [Caenorhabditis remanei]